MISVAKFIQDDLRARMSLAKFSGALAAFVAKQNPDIAYQAAENAIENNAMLTGMLEGEEALTLAAYIKEYSDALAKDVSKAIGEATSYLKELPPEALKAMEKLTQWFETHGEGAMLTIKDAQILLKDAPAEILDAVTTWVKENPVLTEIAVAGLFGAFARNAEDNGKEQHDFLPSQRQVKQMAVFTMIKTWPKLIKNALGKLGKTNKVKADVKGTPQTAAVHGADGTVKPKTSEAPQLEKRQNLSLKFNKDSAVEHFGKHGDSVMDALEKSSYNLKDYMSDANYIINQGTYVPEMNGFVKLIGGQGNAKVAFVGISSKENVITTFHIKTVGEIAKKAPSLGWNN